MYNLINKKRISYVLTLSSVVVVIILYGIVSNPTNRFAAEIIPLTDPTVSICGARSASDVTITNLVKPTNAAIKVIDSSVEKNQIGNFHFWYGATQADDRVYLRIAKVIRIYDPNTWTKLSEFTLPYAHLSSGDFALDPTGNIYVNNVTQGLYKFDIQGNEVWHVNTAVIDSAPYGYPTANGYRIGIIPRGKNGSITFDIKGNKTEDNIIIGGNIHVSKNTGEIVSSGGGYVRVYNAEGTVKRIEFGTNLGAGAAGPMHFYIQGGADILSNGNIAVADVGRGLRVFDSTGIYLGMAKDGGALDNGVTGVFAAGAPMEWYHGNLFYTTSEGQLFTTPTDLTYMTEDNLTAFVAYPQGAPFGLGIGAGPFVKVKGNFFPYGTTPEVFLQFYPFWSQIAAQNNLSGQYTIRDLKQIKANISVQAQSFSIPTGATSVMDIPVNLPSTDPGFYELDIKLSKNGQVVGADCVQYAIGAQGMTFDPSQLTGGSNTTEIKLAHMLGQKMLRGRFQLETFLPDDPNSVTPLDFSSIDSDIQAAGTYADANGLNFELQMAAGGIKEKALASTGNWQRRVQETVTHFKGYIHAWEAWNEPNGGYYGSGPDFANNVLKPFYTGVKAGDATATVVAGGIIGTDTSYWNAIYLNGGFDYFDVVGIHPYVGHNRSFEEQGSVNSLLALKQFFTDHGKANVPIWDTESGFWDSGTNSFYAQGDKIIRKVVLENSIGIENYAYFFNIGGYTVDGLYRALYPDSVGRSLSTGGLAMANLNRKIGNRKFESWINTGVPHTYAAVYGKVQGSQTDDKKIVLWAEDYTIDMQLTLPNENSVNITDEWGKDQALSTTSGVVNLNITGSPIYIDIPANVTPTVTSVEDFGQNNSLASQGASATATSNLTPNPPSAAIDGIMDTKNKGGNTEGISVWIQNTTDSNPELTIHLPGAKELNRILVSSQGIASVQTGLRNYDVQLKNGSGSWQTVASVRNDFFARNHLVAFDSQTATDIKITNMAVNYSGYMAGIKPDWWPSTKSDVWVGQTTIYEIEAYSPGQVHEISLPNPRLNLNTSKFVKGINMVSFPGLSENKFTDFFNSVGYRPGIDYSIATPEGNGKSKILAYSSDQYTRYDSVSQNLAPQLGKGYYMRVFDNDSLVNINFLSAETSPITVNVTPKWNLLGNPFTTNLDPSKFTIVAKNGTNYSFDEAVSQNLVMGYMYTWERAISAYKFISPFSIKYSNQDNYQKFIEPWRGFWFYVRSDQVDKIIMLK